MSGRRLLARAVGWPTLAAAALLVALVAAVAVVSAGSPGDDATRPMIGFNNNAVTDGVAKPDQAAELLAAAGGEIDRVQISWAAVEPTPGRFDFSVYDQIYEADLAHGIRPLFIFAFAPRWAAARGSCDPAQPGCHLPPAPEHYPDVARAVAEVAERYPEAAGIEIWNEPNAPYFWQPAADPAAYAALLEVSYDAVKEVDQAMPVAGVSTSSSPGFAAGHVKAPDFLRGVYEQGGGEAMDAISLHTYPDARDTTVQSAVDAVEQMRAVRDSFGARSTPLWITETGMTTTGPDAVTEEVQALATVRLYDRLAQIEDVEMILFHTLVDPPRGTEDRETGFGLVRSDQRPKPAYCALAAAVSGDRGC